MSYTLKKLKQSEIDRGYRKPPVNKKTKPSYGLFVACFSIFVALALVLVEKREDIFSHQMFVSSKQLKNPSNDTHNGIASTNIVNERMPERSVKKEENVREEKKDRTIDIADVDKVIAEEHISESSLPPSIKTDPYLNNLLAEDKGVKKLTIRQHRENNSIEEKEEQVTNLAGYVKEQSSVKEEGVPEEKDIPSNEQAVLWQDLPSDFRKSLPEMDLNGIAFLDKEEERYIFINMDKYQVDDLVDMGPAIEEIKQNSVIMNYKNRRFILSLRE